MRMRKSQTLAVWLFILCFVLKTEGILYKKGQNLPPIGKVLSRNLSLYGGSKPDFVKNSVFTGEIPFLF